MSNACHLCGSADLWVTDDFSGLTRVTSDCRPWPAGGKIAVCGACATVQKVIDAAWRADAEAIYAGYALYHQSATKAEQHSFDPPSGFGQPRSSWILEKLKAEIDVSRSGRMLDLGCGIGVTLSAFHTLAPDWALEGFDPHLQDTKALSALPGVVAVHGGTLADLPPGFRCITCFHVLEHIVDPIETLRQARALLEADGRLIIQIPYYRDNPFDLTIADHCSHFTPDTLAPLLARAGLEIVLCSTEIVRREMTVVARLGAASKLAAPSAAPEIAAVNRAGLWLRSVLSVARGASEQRPFGIFGTSIAGTFVASALNGATDFFVDEDSTRAGGRHLDRPILAPGDVPQTAALMIALTPNVGDAVARRLSGRGYDLYLPPPIPADTVEQR